MRRRGLFLLWSTLALVAVMAACSETMTPIDGQVSRTLKQTSSVNLLGLSLLSCTATTADSVTQEVGPSGGTIYVGAHKLVIPEGALDSTVAITAVAPSDTINRVHFSPDGLTFSPKASLEMSYANCGSLGLLPLRKVVYVGTDLSLLDLLPSLDDLSSKTVTGKVSHFSDYAVAW